MANSAVLEHLQGRNIVVIGLGPVATAVISLLIEEFGVSPSDIYVISPQTEFAHLIECYGFNFIDRCVTPQNYASAIKSSAKPGDVVLNLAPNVSSCDLIAYCWDQNLLYLDTSIESWGSTDLVWEQRQHLLRSLKGTRANCTTALTCHGANPGLVSHFVRRALEQIARERNLWSLHSGDKWSAFAKLAHEMRVATIQIAEYDSQELTGRLFRNDLLNTWSVNGLIEEMNAAASWACGTNELPNDKREYVRLSKASSATLVRSWIPSCGGFTGYLVSHPEVFSIAEKLTIRDGNGEVSYRPSVQFAYLPCPGIRPHLVTNHKSLYGLRQGILVSEQMKGTDELGVVLLRSGTKQTFWFGSTLDVSEARKFVKHGNATSVQVAAGVISGLQWVLNNPYAGLVEPEDVDTDSVLNTSQRYLGSLRGIWSTWPWRRRTGIEPNLRWEYAELSHASGLDRY